MKLKYIISGIALLALSAIIYGFSIKESTLTLAHKYIGGGTAALFFVVMPLFLYKESKGKKVKDYMLTEDNIKKMREKREQKHKNQ